MLTGLYSAASGLQAAERIHDVIAENLAHLNVPGYRGQSIATQTFEQAMQGALERPSPEGHGAVVAQIATDFTPGATAQTGRPLDVSISGDGFFEVAGPNGPLYTRNGVFQVNQDRQIVTSDGLVVQGTTGPITLADNATTEDINISRDGNVSVNGQTLDQLRLVSFADKRQLTRVGTTLFSAPPAQAPQPADVTVMQGVRELSNVSAVGEMVRMIWGTRHYEAAQKAMSTLDEAISKTTNPQD
ncbi:MAG: flagellar basal-body rod protein FlgF [Planctomycetales bacterium]|nr:flagellar basal-body rod protein FlgF [Planctomycetales bacterium]